MVAFSNKDAVVARSPIWTSRLPNFSLRLVCFRAPVYRQSDSIDNDFTKDFIVMKEFTGRDHDWIDVTRIIGRERTILNRRAAVDRLRQICDLAKDTRPAKRLVKMIHDSD